MLKYIFFTKETLSGIIALSIALLTINWQSWKAATHNPVETLRYKA